MRLLSTAAALLLLIAGPVLAQEAVEAREADEEPRPRYGLFADFAWNFHHADFSALPGVPSCCPRWAPVSS